jgi:low affinity Fe/Cu permease
MNTLSSIVTFLMVFLIQNAQNRESAALQLKLDELIRVTGAEQDDGDRATVRARTKSSAGGYG